MAANFTFRVHSEAVVNIPYSVYFDFVPYEKWSLKSYITLLVNNYEHVDKKEAHFAFYRNLCSILDDEKMSQEVRDIAKKLLKSKKTDVSKANNSFWNTSSPASSSSNNGKKRSATELISTSSIIPTINTEMTCFVPDVDVPLKANGLLDILEVIKSAVHTFDKDTIEIGVGSSVAIKWYAKGHKTFEDVLKNEKLTHCILTEVQKISDWVKSAALSIDYKLECITTGSFGRGSPVCEDINIMITRNDSDGKNHLGVLTKLVEILSNQGFLTHELTRHDGDSLFAKFMGIYLFTVSYNEIGAALLSYTGGVKYNEGKLLAQKTEQEIFDVLGVPWR
ncbi:4969_t:CDS:2 [Funneliformis caledonium]|uniref:4969_t:CDS:1 n=1 Tax=Funneliformis caledonium TaxID=1117310 RepID=A0A9N9BXG8_9GLOM|nr:4969_t:CDS:2 [Funneliformis caledonium]